MGQPIHRHGTVEVQYDTDMGQGSYYIYDITDMEDGTISPIGVGTTPIAAFQAACDGLDAHDEFQRLIHQALTSLVIEALRGLTQVAEYVRGHLTGTRPMGAMPRLPEWMLVALDAAERGTEDERCE